MSSESVPQNTTGPNNVGSTTSTTEGAGIGHLRNIGNELGSGHHRHASDEPVLPGQGADAGVYDYSPDNTNGYPHQVVHPHHKARHDGHDNLGTSQQYPQELSQSTYAGGGRAAHGSDPPLGSGAQGVLNYFFFFLFSVSSVNSSIQGPALVLVIRAIYPIKESL